MTIGITPSSMPGKGGKRLNRNNSRIKSIFYKINYLPTRSPRTKAASPSNPCNSQIDFGFPASASFNTRSISSFWGHQYYSRKASALVRAFRFTPSQPPSFMPVIRRVIISTTTFHLKATSKVYDFLQKISY